MIRNVRIINYLGEELLLDMRFPEQSGFRILKIDGIGAGSANINMQDLATGDGSLYNSAKINSRNIVFYLELEEFPTIELTRQLSYKFFPLKKPITMIFTTDTRQCEIIGYVETNEPDIFSRRQRTQISVRCPDPYFYSLVNYVTVFYGVNSLFEFPFSNESLTNKLLEFGDIQNKTTNTVYYEGDAEVGIVIRLRAIGNATNVTIFNLGTRESLKIDTTKLATMTGFGIISGDEIIISTLRDNMYIYLFRDGEYTNILNCLDKNASWFQISKGDNIFAYTADSGLTNLEFKIQNRLVYEGI